MPTRQRQALAATTVTIMLLSVAQGSIRRSSHSPAFLRPSSSIFKSTTSTTTHHHQQQGTIRFHRTGIITHDTRRKRRQHYDTTVPTEDGSFFDNWEFGQSWGGPDHHTGRKTPPQYINNKKKPFAKPGQDDDGDNDDLDDGEERMPPVMEGEAEEDKEEERQVDDVAAATNCLAQFCTDKRLQRLRDIVGKRTQHATFVFENVANPNNLWACLRSLDAFGIQYAHVIVDPAHYRKAHRLQQAKSAMGSQKWLTLTEHPTAAACVAALKEQGYTVLASDLKPGTTPTPIQDVDWKSQKIAVVMGNEERGITQEMRDLCDGTYQIPMMGFAESFNLSVSTAVTLAYLSSLGGLQHGDLTQTEKDRLVLRWLIKSVPQGAKILRREGLLAGEGVEKAHEAPKNILGFTFKGRAE